MKTIGILGGTGWHSTISHYRMLNEMANAQLGGRHSAEIILRSIDFHEMRSKYENWPEVLPMLKSYLQELASYRPGCILIANNALHKAYDAIAHELALPMPVIHMVQETAEFLVQRSYKHVLLLGTKLTMEDGYYAGKLKQMGLEVTIPDEQQRQEMQNIQTHVAATGYATPEQVKYFLNILQKHSQCNAAVLACTELPLIFQNVNQAPMPVIDPGRIQCRQAIAFALSN